MTWVVGTHVPSVAIMLADVRASTLSGDPFPFRLRKVHPIAGNIVMGFCGSVETGLSLVDIARAVNLERHLDRGVHTEDFLERFEGYLNTHFIRKFRGWNRQCILMLMGAIVHEGSTLGRPPLAARMFCEVWTCPATANRRVVRKRVAAGRVAHIGSGSDVPTYAEAALSLQDQEVLSGVAAWDHMVPGGTALVVSSFLHNTATSLALERTVSEELLTATCRFGEVPTFLGYMPPNGWPVRDSLHDLKSLREALTTKGLQSSHVLA